MTFVKWLIFSSLILGASALFAQNDGKVILVESDNVYMENAFAEAQKTLPNFIERSTINRSGDEIYGAYIKVIQNDVVEYLWVSDFKKYDEVHFIGVLIMEPELTSLYEYGTTIGFQKSDIYDWQIYNKLTEITEGMFTSKVLEKKD